MRYRAVQRSGHRWAVRDTERQQGGHWWPFHQLSESFEFQYPAEHLAGLLNAITDLAERIEWIDTGELSGVCFACHRDYDDGHADDCPWLVLKAAL